MVAHRIPPEDEQRILRLLRDGVKPMVAARQVGRSPGAAYRIARENGIDYKPALHPVDQKDKLGMGVGILSNELRERSEDLIWFILKRQPRAKTLAEAVLNLVEDLKERENHEA